MSRGRYVTVWHPESPGVTVTLWRPWWRRKKPEFASLREMLRSERDRLTGYDPETGVYLKGGLRSRNAPPEPAGHPRPPKPPPGSGWGDYFGFDEYPTAIQTREGSVVANVMLRELREAAGLPNVAMGIAPMELWQQTLDAVHDMAPKGRVQPMNPKGDD